MTSTKGGGPPCLCPKGSKCSLKSPAVNLGTGIFSDKSVDLLKNVDEFVRKHTKDPERVFVTRFAMKPCFVLASNELIREFLSDPSTADDFYNGLQDYFLGLFGRSIMFGSGYEEASHYRKILSPLFSPESVAKFEPYLRETLDHWSLGIEKEQNGTSLYSAFKSLSLAYNLKLFLNVDAAKDTEFFDKLSALATQHWHGVISVPLNFRIGFLASSGYRKAQEAKEEILAVISNKIRDNRSPFLEDLKATGMSEEMIGNHVLIFVCALIPKAAGSILANAIYTSKLWLRKYQTMEAEDESKAENYLKAVILEVIRLWPPFVGGLRVAVKDTVIGKQYCVPKGYGVFWHASSGHRDPRAFIEPDLFNPSRWMKEEDFEEKGKLLFGFGAGVHRCPGETFMWKFLVSTLRHFVSKFQWSDEDMRKMDGTHAIKFLPVSRPKNDHPIRLQNRNL